MLELKAAALEPASYAARRPEGFSRSGGKDDASGGIQHSVRSLTLQALLLPGLVHFIEGPFDGVVEPSRSARAVEADFPGQVLRALGHRLSGQDVALRTH